MGANHLRGQPDLCGVRHLPGKADLAATGGTAYTKAMSNFDDRSQDPRRKRIKFRAWHRGMKEVDLVLGPFADMFVDQLDEAGLVEFEQLLSVPDNDLYDWLCERRTPPDGYRTKLYEQIHDFSRRAGRV
jgi:antitoxin CptB